MKNILFLFVLVVAFSSVNANGIAFVSPVGTSIVKSGNVFKVFYKGEKPGTVKVSIYNAKGDVVWNETLRNRDNFMRPYNFSSLPAGDYSIVVKDEKGKHVERITHSVAKSQSKAHLTVVDRKEQKYLLTVPDRGSKTLTVRIFDDSQNLIYQNVEMVKGNFGKVYNMSNIHGAFTFEITDAKGKTDRIIE